MLREYVYIETCKDGRKNKKKGLIVKEIMKKRNLFLIFGCLFLIALPGKAQVTIGSDSKPLDGALLQLKTNDGTADNANGGLLLPRVALASTTDISKISGMTAATQANYKGLVIYNVTTTVPAVPSGTYVWTGTKWHLLENSDSFTLTAKNGLTYANNDSIVLGGKMTAPTTTIDLDDKTLIFDNTNSPAYSNSTRNVGLILKDLPDITSNSVGLVIDRVTGRLGMNSAGIPARLVFFQAAEEEYVSNLVTAAAAAGGSEGVNEDSENENNTYIIPWSESSDAMTNNLLSFDPLTNTFVVPDTVSEIMLELSGYIGYIPNANAAGSSNPSGSDQNPPSGTSGATDANVTIVNAAIQIQYSTSSAGSPPSYTSSAWTNWTSVRGTYQRPVTWYRQTLSIPPALVKLSGGDRIRMVVIPRPVGLGVAHNRGKVVRPFGTNIAKAIKIIAQ